MADELLDDLEALENQAWSALCDGTASTFYGQAMTSDSMMVLADGSTMTRDDVVNALRETPPWGGYRLRDVRLVTTGGDSAALVYRAAALGDGDEVRFEGVMTSVYLRVQGSWRLALHTQTPLPRS